MKYLNYKEERRHGGFEFPFAFYHESPNSPRYQMLHHWHPEFELVHIRKGSMTMQIEDQEIQGSAGDSFLVTGGMVHSCIPKDCHYECMVFDMDFLLREQPCCRPELLSITLHNRILQSYYPAEWEEENRLFTRLLEAFARKSTGYELIVQGNLFQFLGLALEKDLFQSIEKLPDHFSKTKQFKTVMSLIRQHYSENITLNEMAGAIHMNPNYFCRFFKEITHQTPMQYLNYYRIECACEKLAASNRSITEISMECGFNDVSYFVKVFKKYKGITPSEYLKSLPF